MYINIYKCIINLINFVTATISFVLNVLEICQTSRLRHSLAPSKTKQIVTTQDLIIMIIITTIIIIITKIKNYLQVFIYSLQVFLISSWFSATVTAYWKHLLYFSLMEFILALLLFIQSRESIYDSFRLKFILWYL